MAAPVAAALDPAVLVGVIAALAACFALAITWGLSWRDRSRFWEKETHRVGRLLGSAWGRRCGTTVDQATADRILAQLLRTPK